MFSRSILMGCLPLQKLSRLIKRHCFRGRPTPCLQDERMRVHDWRAYVETMKKGFPGLLQNFWGSLEKWRKECRKESPWKQKPDGEVVCVALHLALRGRARTENTNFKKNCWSRAARGERQAEGRPAKSCQINVWGEKWKKPPAQHYLLYLFFLHHHFCSHPI